MQSVGVVLSCRCRVFRSWAGKWGGMSVVFGVCDGWSAPVVMGLCLCVGPRVSVGTGGESVEANGENSEEYRTTGKGSG